MIDTLVSIITPTTKSRESYLKELKRCVKGQTYGNVEHIIVHDETASIGAKRNIACNQARGEIIVHFDDDDLYASDYISKCVEQLQTCDTTGLSSAYFTDGVKAWVYEYRGKQPYICGSGMAFWKRIWERNKFKDISNGEDTMFCANAGYIIPHGYIDGFIARIHSKSTASHKAVPSMKEISIDLLPKL